MARTNEEIDGILVMASDLDRIRPTSIQLLVNKAKSLGDKAKIVYINESADTIQIETGDGRILNSDRIRNIYK